MPIFNPLVASDYAVDLSDMMSQFSKMQHSRNQWKHKAKQRGKGERYQLKENTRIKAERDRVTRALKETEAQVRQLKAQLGGLATRPKVDLIDLALQLCLEARIGFRAVSTRCGPGHQESAMSSNHYQLGHPAQHRAHRLRPYPAGLTPAPGSLYQQPHLDDRYQYWLGLGQDSRGVSLGRPSPSARVRGPIS